MEKVTKFILGLIAIYFVCALSDYYFTKVCNHYLIELFKLTTIIILAKCIKRLIVNLTDK